MIVVKVELHSALTGEVTELGRMHLSNQLGRTMADPRRGDYKVKIMRKGTKKVQRQGEVLNWPRKSYPIWRLVLKALQSVYPEGK